MVKPTPVRIVDASSRTHNVHVSEFPDGDVEHALELRPVGYIGFEKYSAGPAVVGCELVNQALGFRAESDVGDEDTAAALEKECCKGEVDS